jgi:hypothetical protein
LAGGEVMAVNKLNMSMLWVQLEVTRLRRGRNMKQQGRWERKEIDKGE